MQFTDQADFATLKRYHVARRIDNNEAVSFVSTRARHLRKRKTLMGGLTTHVLDTAHGKPGNGIPLTLHRVDTTRELLVTTITNNDGRTDIPLLDDRNHTPGTYELTFQVAEYFRKKGAVSDEAFLDNITLRFTITDNTHYHVPLLVSPWSYSTYRGS
jgi:5-hydroxyisourate hydrolase